MHFYGLNLEEETEATGDRRYRRLWSLIRCLPAEAAFWRMRKKEPSQPKRAVMRIRDFVRQYPENIGGGEK